MSAEQTQSTNGSNGALNMPPTMASTSSVAPYVTAPTIIGDRVAVTKALVKVQATLRPATKDKANTHFGNKYADLASVWDAAREPLVSNGFAVVQLPTTSRDCKTVSIRTVLLHESGGEISNDLMLPVVKQDPQGFGSAITYGRRYALAAILGIAPEDDDGNAASGISSKSTPPPPAGLAGVKARMPKPTPVPAPASNGSSVRAGHDRSLAYPFGNVKGKPIAEVDDKSIAFWMGKVQAELADASKSKWHAKAAQTLATLQAEQRYRAAMVGQDEAGSSEGGGPNDEPPPLTDEDAPY